MAAREEIGERLREASCVGDLELVKKLVLLGADVNSTNSLNGWTALHWACKRNHVSVVSYLKGQGADNTIMNKDGHTPGQLSTNEEIRLLFNVPASSEPKVSNLPITPNYLANPVFPYANGSKGNGQYNNEISHQHQPPGTFNELVLKARVANCEERDFIEIELDRSALTYSCLLQLMCDELGIDKKSVQKVRKLPDTTVRKDKDVGRLKDFQEVELVLASRAMSAASRTFNLAPAKNNETILY